MIEKLKQEVKQATLSKDVTRRDLLRYILGEAQSKDGSYLSSADIKVKIKRLVKDQEDLIEKKLVKGEMLTRMQEEIEILREYLPKQFTKEELEGIILNSNGPEFEIIRDAKSEGRAMGVAMKFLKESCGDVDGLIVKEIVNKIRKE